jgi:hypothetical protein
MSAPTIDTGPCWICGGDHVAGDCRRERAALKKDAERYRWMRENDWDSPIVKLGYDDYDTLKGAELDAAVDEAMKADR